MRRSRFSPICPRLITTFTFTPEWGPARQRSRASRCLLYLTKTLATSRGACLRNNTTRSSWRKHSAVSSRFSARPKYAPDSGYSPYIALPRVVTDASSPCKLEVIPATTSDKSRSRPAPHEIRTDGLSHIRLWFLTTCKTYRIPIVLTITYRDVAGATELALTSSDLYLTALESDLRNGALGYGIVHRIVSRHLPDGLLVSFPAVAVTCSVCEAAAYTKSAKMATSLSRPTHLPRCGLHCPCQKVRPLPLPPHSYTFSRMSVSGSIGKRTTRRPLRVGSPHADRKVYPIAGISAEWLGGRRHGVTASQGAVLPRGASWYARPVEKSGTRFGRRWNGCRRHKQTSTGQAQANSAASSAAGSAAHGRLRCCLAPRRPRCAGQSGHASRARLDRHSFFFTFRLGLAERRGSRCPYIAGGRRRLDRRRCILVACRYSILLLGKSEADHVHRQLGGFGYLITTSSSPASRLLATWFRTRISSQATLSQATL